MQKGEKSLRSNAGTDIRSLIHNIFVDKTKNSPATGGEITKSVSSFKLRIVFSLVINLSSYKSHINL